MNTTETTIRAVVEQVLQQLGTKAPPAAPKGQALAPKSAILAPGEIPVLSSRNGSSYAAPSRGTDGVFQSVDDAVAAASDAFEKFRARPVTDREKVVQIVKTMCEQQAEELGRLEMEETKIGRLDHKIEKLKIIKLVPGTEFLKPIAYTGEHGLSLIEQAPFGVIGAITPVTHSLPTLAGNVVNMAAAGNSMVFNPHPSGAKIACEGVRRFNRAISASIGIENLITIIEKPTIESADQIFQHRGVRMLCVTGGPAVARAALAARKKSVVAGPGNPPVVVDETADIDNAAKCIVQGAAYDNNLLCIGEKEVFAVASIFDKLMDAVSRHGGFRLNPQQVDALTKLAFAPPKEQGGHPILNRDMIGRDASVLAEMIGVKVPAGTQLLYGETDTNNPFVPEEQMMPFVPFVRARNSQHAIELAHEAEHGFGHTAILHSRDVRTMTMMGRLMNTTLYIVNGPSMSGLGLGGEGYLSFSVATPSGEGVTTPATFTRSRRFVLANELRMI